MLSVFSAERLLRWGRFSQTRGSFLLQPNPVKPVTLSVYGQCGEQEESILSLAGPGGGGVTLWVFSNSECTQVVMSKVSSSGVLWAPAPLGRHSSAGAPALIWILGAGCALWGPCLEPLLTEVLGMRGLSRAVRRLGSWVWACQRWWWGEGRGAGLIMEDTCFRIPTDAWGVWRFQEQGQCPENQMMEGCKGEGLVQTSQGHLSLPMGSMGPQVGHLSQGSKPQALHCPPSPSHTRPGDHWVVGSGSPWRGRGAGPWRRGG